MKGTWRVVSGLLVFWLLILIYMSTTLYQTSDISERAERQLSKALQELEALKKQNEELQQLAVELKDIQAAIEAKGLAGERNDALQRRLEKANQRLEDLTKLKDKDADTALSVEGDTTAPSLEHEQIRRKVANGMTEFWFYMRSQLNKLRAVATEQQDIVGKIDNILHNAVDHQRVIMTDLYNLSITGGVADWREKEAEELSDLVQRRLHSLQNPEDCSKAQKLVCNINKGCGYGCQIHHVVYCFMIAYGLERTMILESHGWRYSTGGWDKVFLPISDTCTSRHGVSARSWGAPEVLREAHVIELPIVDSLHPRPPYMPQAFPEDLAPRLMRLHGNPAAWFIGQFLKYMLKPQPHLAQDIEDSSKALGFKTPIVGVHVRRTDKVGTEAAFHSMDEYMYHVDQYFDLLEKRQQVDKRRIYLATDDANLLQEARLQYPHYDIISDNGFSQSAGLGSRYTDTSLRGIIMDIHFLSLCDYLVCTFSSQVCRVAYEIMQTLHPDASAEFFSLDDIYYFGGQNAHNVEALYPHHAQTPDEIDLEPGDLIGIMGNHWDGYSKGTNRRTQRLGLFPSYKVREHYTVVRFPAYEDSDNEGR